MRYALPLFTQGVRKSERLAIAMEARGFTGTKERAYYHNISTSWIDYMYLFLIGISVFMCIYFV
ncbi:cobalt transporter [Bacillus safensis FO-36b] [Bacillus safensis subsp. safensis]